MEKLKNLFKKDVEVLEVLKGGEYGSSSFRRAVEKAYMSDSFEKYMIGNNVYFEQGSGRIAVVPKDIVEDILGVEPQVSRRAA